MRDIRQAVKIADQAGHDGRIVPIGRMASLDRLEPPKKRPRSHKVNDRALPSIGQLLGIDWLMILFLLNERSVPLPDRLRQCPPWTRRGLGLGGLGAACLHRD